MKATSETFTQKSHGSLLRVLGVGFGLAVTLGGTIGMGILRTPGEIAKQLPTPSLFIGIWIVGGVYALLGAISVAELGAMIPRSGGFYVFAHRALGNYAGFIVGWSDWMSTCATIALISMVVGEYTGVLFPTLATHQKAVALIVTLFFALLHWRGVLWGSYTQNVTRLITVLAFTAFAILALLHVLGLSRIAGDELAVGTAASVIFGAHGDRVIRVLAIISMLSTINAYTLSAPRTLYAMSCDRLFTHHGRVVNKGGTPTITLLISTIVAVLFIASGTFNQVLAVVAFFFVSYYTMAFISVIVLRRREPDLPRPYRVWGYPWTTLIVILGSVAFLAGAVAGDTKNSLWALGLLAISAPVFLIVKRLSLENDT